MLILIGTLYFLIALIVGFSVFVKFSNLHPGEIKINLIASFIVGFIWPYYIIDLLQGDIT
jgi:hypothetical protein